MSESGKILLSLGAATLLSVAANVAVNQSSMAEFRTSFEKFENRAYTKNQEQDRRLTALEIEQAKSSK